MKNKIFDFFDKAYCINLKERLDRKRSAQNQFKSIGLNDVEFIDAFKTDNEGVFLTKGAHGCALSHLYIYNKVKKERFDNVIIFEDDIIFCEEFLNKVNPILECLKNMDWDIFYFFKPQGGGKGDEMQKRGKILVEYSNEYNDYLVKTSGTLFTHAYAINTKCLDTLIEKLSPDYLEKHNDINCRAFDKAIANLDLNFFACSSDLIYQDKNLYSSINEWEFPSFKHQLRQHKF